MTVLLILAVVWVVVFGYYLMGRIDKHLNHRTFADNPNEDRKKVLFFAAEEDYALLKTSLIDNKMPIMSTCEPNIPDNVHIEAVLAISNNDLDNLLLCCNARHLFPDVYLIAKCNDALYQAIYKDTGVQRIINSDYPEDSILAVIMNSSFLGIDPISKPGDRRIAK